MGMAKILNQFFSSVFTEEGAEPVPEVSGSYQYRESLRSVNFMVKDTRELIKKLKTRGAPGPDGITARLLHYCIINGSGSRRLKNIRMDRSGLATPLKSIAHSVKVV
jgi:hypothetical protein